MFGYFKSTRFKMCVARVILKVMRFFNIAPQRVITRHGVRFDINLEEAIDMSLFLFGSFQKHLTHNKFIQLPEDAIIFDVGANFGSVSLVLAANHKKSTVYSFEPTHYAIEKLKQNIVLNKNILGERVIPFQTFVSAPQSDPNHLVAYASWPIDGVGPDKHPVHLGVSKEATDKQISIDDFVKEQNINRLDLIKIDTDGHELDVLKGSMDTISRFKPSIIFELTIYLMGERGQSFSDYADLLVPLGYRLFCLESSHELRSDNITKVIPRGGAIDVVAVPST